MINLWISCFWYSIVILLEFSLYPYKYDVINKIKIQKAFIVALVVFLILSYIGYSLGIQIPLWIANRNSLLIIAQL